MSKDNPAENEPPRSPVPQKQSTQQNEEKNQKPNLFQLFTGLAIEINRENHNGEGFAREKEDQPEEEQILYGYFSSTIQINTQTGPRTRNRNYNASNRFTNKQCSYISSPNGPFNHSVTNVGHYR